MKLTVNLKPWNNEKTIKAESVNKDLNKAGGSTFIHMELPQLSHSKPLN